MSRQSKCTHDYWRRVEYRCVDCEAQELALAHAAGFREGLLAALRWSWPDTNDAGIDDIVRMIFAPAPAKDGEGET